MSYQVIAAFPGGLDARKFFLSLPAGTLTTLDNAHITQGSEIEKRKLFLPYQLPPGTFGAQETTQGNVLFGSRLFNPLVGDQTLVIGTNVQITVANLQNSIESGDLITVTGSGNANVNGTWTVITVFHSGANVIDVFFDIAVATSYSATEAVTMTPFLPAPVIYQQLVHPLGASMSAVISSTYFEGVTQVITTWDNGDTIVFDGPDVETDWYVGSQCNITPTPYAIANSLVDQATATGRYTGIKPVLAPAFFQVTGGTSSPGTNKVVSVTYNFNRQVTLNISGSPVTASSFSLLASPRNWATSNNATAAALAGDMNTVDGFVVTNTSTNIVQLVPPATDFFGAALGTNPADTVSVVVGGNVTVFIPPYAAKFDILSIPDQSSANPFTVATETVDAGLTYILASSGVPATLPVGASGQFTITAGIPNAQGTGTLTISGTGPANNDTVTFGANTVYTFVTALGRPANQILIGSTIDATLGNFIAAINGAGGAGSIYSSATSPSTQVSASAITSHASVFTAIPNGVPGNIAVASSSGNLVWSGLTTGHLTGGTDTNQITQITVGGVNLLGNEVPFDTNTNQTAADVVTAINVFQGTSGFSSTAQANVITIMPLVGGTSVNNAVLSVQCAGGVCIANCFFVVNGTASGGGTHKITSIKPSATAELLTGGGVAWTAGTLNAYCLAVVANINANSATSGYVAVAVGNQIQLSAATVTSVDPDPLITVTATNLTISNAPSLPLVVTQNNTLIPFLTVEAGFKKSAGAPNSAVVVANGGVAPYSYVWAAVSANPVGVTLVDGVKGAANNWWTAITKGSAPTGQQTWSCTVTDTASNVVVVPFTLIIG